MAAVDVGQAVAYLDLDLDKFNKGLADAQSAISGFSAEMGTSISESVAGAFDQIGTIAQNVGNTLKSTITDPIVDFAKSTIDSGMSFEATMSKVQAITQASGEELEDLKNLAIEMGKDTSFSLTESAEAMVYMGMAGWTTEQIIAGLPGIMYLAQASGEDLAKTSDIVTDSLTAFGMTAGDAMDYANLLAQAARTSNTDVGKMGQTFKYVAPIAATFGMEADDVAVAVGLMANNGIKATQAGTTLRTALTRLVTPTEDAAAMMVRLGLITEETGYIIDNGALLKAEDSVADKTLALEKAQIAYNDAVANYGADSAKAQTAAINLEQAENKLAIAIRELDEVREGELKTIDSQNTLMVDEYGNARDLNDILTDLRASFAGLSQEEQIQAANLLFGKTAMAGMLAIINSSQEDYDDLYESLHNTGEAAKEMAEIMMDNVAGAIDYFNSSLQALKQKFFELYAEDLQNLILKGKEIIDWIASFDKETLTMITRVAALAAALGPALIIFGKMSSGIASIIRMFGSFGGAVTDVIGMIGKLGTGFLGVSGEASTLAGGLGSIGSSAGAALGPILLIAAAVAALVGGFITAFQRSEEFRNSIKELFVHIGSLVKSVMELLMTLWDVLKPIIAQIFDVVASLLETIMPPLVDLIGVLVELIGEYLVPYLKICIEVLGVKLKAAFELVAPLIKLVAENIALIIDIISNVIGIIMDFAKVLHGLVTGDMEEVSEGFASIWEHIKNIFSDAMEWLWNITFGFVAALFEGIGGAFETIFGFFEDFFGNVGGWFGNLITSVFGWLKDIGHGLGTWFADGIKDLGGWLSDIWNNIINWFGDVFGGFIDWLAKIGANSHTWFSDALGKVGDFLLGIWNGIKDAFGNIWNSIVDFFANIWDKIVGFFADWISFWVDFYSNIWESIVNFFSNIWNKIGEFFGNIWSILTGWFKSIKDGVVNWFADHAFEIVNFFSNIMGKVGDFFANLWENIKEWFTSLPERIKGFGKKLWEAGKSLFTMLWDGIKSVWNGLVEWIDDKFGWIGDIFSWIGDKISGFVKWIGLKPDTFSNLLGFHAAGLDYVPYDGYVASLHEGERVLTKQENREYNDNSSGSSGGDVFNFYNTKPDPYEYARQMKRAKKELQFNY